MLESILIVGALVVGLFLYWDIRRRAQVHALAVQRERDAIAELTHSTATLGSFSDGPGSEVLLGASEDSQLFFYRRIEKGKMTAHYSLQLNNILEVTLLINGEKRDYSSESGHMTAQMRATEVAKQARLTLTAQDWESIKTIRLALLFHSEQGGEKTIPVHIFPSPKRNDALTLPKVFENAVWWQQYLEMTSRSKPEEKLPFEV